MKTNQRVPGIRSRPTANIHETHWPPLNSSRPPQPLRQQSRHVHQPKSRRKRRKRRRNPPVDRTSLLSQIFRPQFQKIRTHPIHKCPRRRHQPPPQHRVPQSLPNRLRNLLLPPSLQNILLSHCRQLRLRRAHRKGRIGHINHSSFHALFRFRVNHIFLHASLLS